MKFSGSSGGTPPALLLATKVDIMKAFEILLEESSKHFSNKPFGVNYNIMLNHSFFYTIYAFA